MKEPVGARVASAARPERVAGSPLRRSLGLSDRIRGLSETTTGQAVTGLAGFAYKNFISLRGPRKVISKVTLLQIEDERPRLEVTFDASGLNSPVVGIRCRASLHFLGLFCDSAIDSSAAAAKKASSSAKVTGATAHKKRSPSA